MARSQPIRKDHLRLHPVGLSSDEMCCELIIRAFWTCSPRLWSRECKGRDRIFAAAIIPARIRIPCAPVCCVPVAILRDEVRYCRAPEARCAAGVSRSLKWGCRRRSKGFDPCRISLATRHRSVMPRQLHEWKTPYVEGSIYGLRTATCNWRRY
jgi:hypothetical protein